MPIHVIFDINLQVEKFDHFQIWETLQKVFQIEIFNKIYSSDID